RSPTRRTTTGDDEPMQNVPCRSARCWQSWPTCGSDAGASDKGLVVGIVRNHRPCRLARIGLFVELGRQRRGLRGRVTTPVGDVIAVRPHVNAHAWVHLRSSASIWYSVSDPVLPTFVTACAPGDGLRRKHVAWCLMRSQDDVAVDPVDQPARAA